MGVGDLVFVAPSPFLFVSPLSLQVRHHQRHVRWRDPADATGLGQRYGPNTAQLFAGLESQMANRCVIEALGDPFVSQSLLTGHLLPLPRDVALVLEINRHLLSRLAGNRRKPWLMRGEV